MAQAGYGIAKDDEEYSSEKAAEIYHFRKDAVRKVYAAAELALTSIQEGPHNLTADKKQKQLIVNDLDALRVQAWQAIKKINGESY